MSVLRQAAAELANNDPEFRKALAAQVDEDKRNIKLDGENASATIEWMIPKDVQRNRWSIRGKITMTNPFSGKTEEMNYEATLVLNPNEFFEIEEWHSDPQLAMAMKSLIWEERLKIMDGLPSEDVATWTKLGEEERKAVTERVARRYLLGQSG